MSSEEIIMVIIYIIELVIIGIFYNLYKHYRAKHEEAIESWHVESHNKDKQIEKLQEEIKFYKDMERVIKVEKVIMQPKELECKFMLHDRFIDDTELFKKVIVSEVARYVAEELEKDPHLCKIYHDKNGYAWREDIKVRFRMLPYAEGVVWEDIFKEEE